MRIAVVIASARRPNELMRWVEHASRQVRKPDSLVFAVADIRTDLPRDFVLPEWISLCVSPPGSCVQRNTGLLSVMNDSDIVAFFDDDYVPSIYCIQGIERLFASSPDIVGATGVLLADGVNSSGIGYDEAASMVAAEDAKGAPDFRVLSEPRGLYGCNMVYRVSAIGEERFDEQLPLYAWQEDVDFSARVGRRGRLVQTNAICGVHQGVKGGRTAGLPLGYTQIVNPVYLARKGTLSSAYAAKLIIRNVLKNHARMFCPEPWIDRMGRAKGNWLGLWHVITGRDDPQNVRQLR